VIRLNAVREDGNVRITVSDNGIGIPAEHLPHVFDRFYKADQSRSQLAQSGVERSGGSGLGLSIVKAIVERHGGTVSARSRQGVETVFEIVLPDGSRRAADAGAAVVNAERSRIENTP
jgi:signal transduction histidine kinase